MFIYPRWQPDVHQAWQWIYPLAALAVTILLWTLRGRSRAPLAAWLFFCITLFPVLGFFNVYYFTYSFVADHFQYLACLAIFTFTGAIVAEALSRLTQPVRAVGVASCVVLVASLATLSRQQTPMYADIATLYQTTIERNPTCWLAHNNLGRLFADSGRADDAIAQYRAAIEVKPDYADAHNNLANAMGRLGQMQDALNEFQVAINLDARDPIYHSNLASALVQLGRFPEAIAECREAIRLDPSNFEARLNLGATLFRAGKLSEAIDEIHAAQALRPDDATA
jgi:tetratricopeptide (TPR) repeat protein